LVKHSAGSNVIANLDTQANSAWPSLYGYVQLIPAGKQTIPRASLSPIVQQSLPVNRQRHTIKNTKNKHKLVKLKCNQSSW